MNEDTLQTMRLLLGIEDEKQDGVLRYCLDACKCMVLDYCNIELLPAVLMPVVIDMAIDKYRMEGYGKQGAVAAISEGEQSVSFGNATQLDASGFLKGYAARLNAHRKLRW